MKNIEFVSGIAGRERPSIVANNIKKLSLHNRHQHRHILLRSDPSESDDQTKDMNFFE